MLDFRGEIEQIRANQTQADEEINKAAIDFLEQLLQNLKEIDILSIDKISFNLFQNTICVERVSPSFTIYKESIWPTHISKLKILKKISEILKENEYTLEECGQHSFAIHL